MRRILALVALLAMLVTGCAGLREEARVGPYPGCDTTNRGRLLLMAQAVPGATMIPCLGELPPGWEFGNARTRSDEAILVLTSDTFDLDVQLEMRPSCAVTGTGRASPTWPGVTVHRDADGRRLVWVFEGGCLEIDFPTTELAASHHAREMIDMLGFLTRDELRERSGWEL